MQSYLPQDAVAEIFDDAAVFEVPSAEIKHVVEELCVRHGAEFKLMTATDERAEHDCFKIWYVFGVPGEHFFLVPFIRLQDTEIFPSIASMVGRAMDDERRIKTFFGLTPLEHPDLRPIILHEHWPEDVFPLRKDCNWKTRPRMESGEYVFQKVEGEGIYEIPVGPIHAGIIEPGHFRFSMAGEHIMLLEPRLGYVHKGSEKLFEVLPLEEKITLAEKISGDSSFGHSLAFCQALESLSDTHPSERALSLRVVYAELERLANHFGDLGAIMMDTGYSFGGAHGARMRERMMQINERLTGSRFLRGVNAVGGVCKDVNDTEVKALLAELQEISEDFSEVIAVTEESVSLLNRLKGAGVISLKIAQQEGLVGVAAKAVGIARDTRLDYPYAAYRDWALADIATETSGDVYARFRVRIKEAHASIRIIQAVLDQLPKGAIHPKNKKVTFKKNALSVSAVEGWRGEIVYVVKTNEKGTISRVVPRDPSCVNWAALKHAGYDNVIPDFPLINKSFNLSYSGNDM